MPVTLRSKDRPAAVVLVAKWCLSRGERVTIIVPSPAGADALRPQFSDEELGKITFSRPDAASGPPGPSSRAP